jgi:hypothetical protein
MLVQMFYRNGVTGFLQTVNRNRGDYSAGAFEDLFLAILSLEQPPATLDHDASTGDRHSIATSDAA